MQQRDKSTQSLGGEDLHPYSCLLFPSTSFQCLMYFSFYLLKENLKFYIILCSKEFCDLEKKTFSQYLKQLLGDTCQTMINQ